MSEKTVILLDDGGVMNDNRLRGEQWPALVGAFFAPRLGGELASWAEANRLVIQHILDPLNWQQRTQDLASYASFERQYWLDWLGGMCYHVGIALPGEDECIELARQAESYVIPRVQAAFPGASEAIHHLYNQGYALHTASNESSIHLQLYLESMGVHHCFGRFYGADLLDSMKDRPLYYQRLFADLQLNPGRALVVDDNPHALSWASSLGARTVLVSAEPDPQGTTLHITSLAELPTLLARIE